MKHELVETLAPDAVRILGRLESLIAGGMSIGLIEKRTGVDEALLNALLDEKDRDSLGKKTDGYAPPHRNGKREQGRLLKIDEWLNALDQENRIQQARIYTEIPTSLYISGLAVAALEEKRLFHLIGGYGISKTKTLERFAQLHPMTHERPGAAYLALTAEDNRATQIYQRISDAMRINEKFHSRGRSIGQRVRNTLRAGDLLIVDEANYAFEHGTWKTLRDIFDASSASLLLVSNITSNGFVKKNQDELGAFLSRARTRYVDKNDPADGEKYAVCLGYTAPAILEEAKKMVSRTGPAGGMRFLAKAFEDAEARAAKLGRAVDLTMLRDAAKMNSAFYK